MKQFILLIAIATPCMFRAQNDSLLVVEDSVMVQSSPTMVDSVITLAQTFIGTPYQYGSTSTRSFDCSGFVCHVYGSCGIKLPHGSAGQAQLCDEVKLKDLQPGDLMFFKGRSTKSSRIGHVALVIAVNDDVIKIIHATHRGVVIDVFNESEYYTKRFVKAGRLKNEIISRG